MENVESGTPPVSASPPARKPRSKSRQRKMFLGVRLTEQERDALHAAAARAGLDVAAYVRRQTIGQIGPRTRPRKIGPDIAALAALCTQLGYAGNNLNQLTRLANMGDLDRPAELDRVLSFLLDLLKEARAAMRAEAG